MKIRINWKHILFHFLGLWMVAHAFMILAFLTNVEASETFGLTHGFGNTSSESITYLAMSIPIAKSIGYIAALILCFVASSKIKNTYVNTIIAYAISFTINTMIGDGWSYLKNVFLVPGSLFAGWPRTNGILMLVPGLFFIFLIKRFYKNNDHANSTLVPQYTL